ncbi:MAG: hypothetical protein IT384_03530 [Deltaproteobacteria bacterium]|nr:hypothetical protein [Deltaproteobacteria bacterium]
MRPRCRNGTDDGLEDTGGCQETAGTGARGAHFIHLAKIEPELALGLAVAEQDEMCSIIDAEPK